MSTHSISFFRKNKKKYQYILHKKVPYLELHKLDIKVINLHGMLMPFFWEKRRKILPTMLSIVSLTSSLVVKMLIVLVSTISNSQVFLLKKCE